MWQQTELYKISHSCSKCVYERVEQCGSKQVAQNTCQLGKIRSLFCRETYPRWEEKTAMPFVKQMADVDKHVEAGKLWTSKV